MRYLSHEQREAMRFIVARELTKARDALNRARDGLDLEREGLVTDSYAREQIKNAVRYSITAWLTLRLKKCPHTEDDGVKGTEKIIFEILEKLSQENASEEADHDAQGKGG